MNWDIKRCKEAIEGWQGVQEFGLFVNGFLITAFLRGSETEFNVDQALGEDFNQILVGMQINYEASVIIQTSKPDNIVYDLFFNKIHISRFAKGSLVYQNVLKIFKIEPPTN